MPPKSEEKCGQNSYIINFLFPMYKGMSGAEIVTEPIEERYDKVSANVMISVQKMGESESGQIVF